MAHARSFISASSAEPPFYVGVDLGGTSIKLGVVDDQGRPLSWLGMPTEPTQGAEAVTRRMAEGVLLAIKQAGLERSQVVRVGLGAPGTMDVPAGLLLEPPNLPGWVNYPIRDRLREFCGIPVTFANDANAAAYGEFWVGSGRPLHSMVLFTLGTGIGCGIIIHEQVIDGEHSHGGECGHIIINCSDDAPLCECGHRGHLEAYCGAKAVIRRAHEALAASRNIRSTLHDRVAKGQELTPLLVSEAAEADDPIALELIRATGRYLAVGVATLMNTVDPNGVILGGAMTFGGNATKIGRMFLDSVRAEVLRLAFPVPAKKTVIEYALLGADAGFIGAAGIARCDHERGVC